MHFTEGKCHVGYYSKNGLISKYLKCKEVKANTLIILTQILSHAGEVPTSFTNKQLWQADIY